MELGSSTQVALFTYKSLKWYNPLVWMQLYWLSYVSIRHLYLSIPSLKPGCTSKNCLKNPILLPKSYTSTKKSVCRPGLSVSLLKVVSTVLVLANHPATFIFAFNSLQNWFYVYHRMGYHLQCQLTFSYKGLHFNGYLLSSHKLYF